MSYSLKISPTLSNFDLGGVMHHARYAIIFEEVRESFLEFSGLPYRDLANLKLHLVVKQMELNFLKPIFYGEKFTARLDCTTLNRASFILKYTFETAIELKHIASTTHTLIRKDQNHFTIEPLSEKLIDIFRKIKTL